jgi:hypothetical protein
MVMLTGMAIYLHRHSGQTDLCFHSSSGNRRGGAEQLIGLFSSSLYLRLSLAENPTVAELCQHTRSTVLDAYAHSDIALDFVPHRLNQLNFNYLHLRHDPNLLRGLRMRRRYPEGAEQWEWYSPFKLILWVEDYGAFVKLWALHQIDWSTGDEMNQFLAEYCRVLERLVEADLDTRLGDFVRSI